MSFKNLIPGPGEREAEYGWGCIDAGSREGPELLAVGRIIPEGRGEFKGRGVDPGMDHGEVPVDRDDRNLRPFGDDGPPFVGEEADAGTDSGRFQVNHFASIEGQEAIPVALKAVDEVREDVRRLIVGRTHLLHIGVEAVLRVLYST